ncbi:flagellar biosynthesis protein FlhF [Aliikangiella marina]|uniref:Flagellar biosynthesis protein FlhF n=1 Tax=Aliikangiella marina TaxID=1712262 RepID=A0A545TDR2_9GAMM|nr:flagellar biosynthesis protein FlhF [Aliikangiella marina]TQV75359.1 flagellar biosynthesis protein FlhF [Aliikangiella marina]
MKIRRFFGPNIRSALRQVTEEFGNDAAILSNNKVAGGVEVIAALDYDDSLVPPSVDKNGLGAPDLQSQEEAEVQSKFDEPAQGSEASNAHQTAAADVQQSSFEAYQGLQDIQSSALPPQQSANQETGGNVERSNRPPLQQPNVTGDSVVSPIHGNEKIEWTLDPSLQAMKEELGMMRSMMSEQLKGIGWHQFAQQSPLSAMILRRLSKLGLDSDFLNSLMPHVKQQSDAECAWQQILAILAKSLPIAGSDLLERGGVYAFVGATGVGKTTTIAKLAARYVIKNGADSVALISADNYRISAQEQLTTFGRILQIETARVTEKQSLESLMKKFANKSLVLIDTAGMSRNDPHLVQQLESLNRLHKPIHKLLVVSATSQGAVIQESINFFNAYEPSGLVVTKLDEAASLGELMSVVTKARIPVVYTTDGQRVPEDIRVARSHHLVSKAVWLANKYSRTTDDWSLAQNIDQARSA